MKSRSIEKRLMLHKETISNLGNVEMKGLQGGAQGMDSQDPGENTCLNSMCPILTCTCECDEHPY